MPTRPAPDPDGQMLADLRALIPADASPERLRADLASLYAPAPPAPARFVPILSAALLDGVCAAPAPGFDAPLVWDLHAAAIRALSPGPRAVLCAAFHLRARSWLDRPEDLPIAPADRISAPRKDLIAALLPIARDLRAADIAAIAAADHGKRAAEHARAITDAVRQGAFANWTEDGWDCLERASVAPDGPGWAPCTAWILIRALKADDPGGVAAFRWDRLSAAYLALPPPLRPAILNAFRGVMERDPDWPVDGAIGFDAPPPIPYEGPMF